jgi:hypothetical protein
MNEPTMPEEWQLAVDGSYSMILIEKARVYGFITGGPTINVARCEEMLRRGEALGYRPNRSILAVVAGGLAAEGEAEMLERLLENIADEARA